MGWKEASKFFLALLVVVSLLSSCWHRWDEVLLAQFPSFKHWCEMACDPEYQEGNYKWRLPILRDTCILLVTEVHLDWTIEGSDKVKLEDTGHGSGIERSE